MPFSLEVIEGAAARYERERDIQLQAADGPKGRLDALNRLAGFDGRVPASRWIT